MSADLKYLPTLWMDEFIPETFPHPNGFIQPQSDDRYFIGYPADHDDFRDPETCPQLIDGEIHCFSVFEDLGVHSIGFDESGKPVLPAAYPAWANQHADAFDYESGGDSLEDLIKQLEDLNVPFSFGDCLEVKVGNWKEVFFKFKKPKSRAMVDPMIYPAQFERLDEAGQIEQSRIREAEIEALIDQLGKDAREIEARNAIEGN